MKGSMKFYAGRGWVVQYYDPRERKRIFKTFKQQDDAEFFKAHLNVSRKEGKLDARDYAKDNPLGFRTQAERWLAYRKGKVKDLRHAEAHIDRAMAFFGDRNIKEIQYAELDDFLTSLPEDLSSKTKHNIFTTLHILWTWVYNREKKRGFVMPDWPETKFTLGWRQIVDKETQAAIIDEVKRISYNRNPRTWFAIFLLASYPKVRPGELIQVNEKDVNRTTGEMWIRHTKEGKEKRIYLLEEDLAFVNSLPVGLPDLPFFRHEKMKGISQTYRMKYLGRFGKDHLYNTWKKACRNLGIENVDLYGGTKHSTVTAAREIMTPEEIRRYVTEHQTNVAFDRYLQVDAQKQREASTKIRASLHTSCIHENGVDSKAKILKLRN